MKKDIKKNNNKKKGFTLIELLVIILILSIVVGFSYYVITSSLKKAKEKTYLTTKTNIEKIASSYVLENSGKMFFTTKESDTENEYQCITVEELVNSGYFKEDVYNSLYAEGAKVNSDNGVIIVRDKSNKVIKSSRFNATSECNDIRTSRGHNISHTEEFTIKDGRYGKKVTIYYEIRNYDRIDNVKYGYKIGSEDDSNYFRTLKEIKEVYVYDDTVINAYIDGYSPYVINIKLNFNFIYNLDGGINYIGAPSTYKYGVETIINGIPTKSGYTFNGWKNTTDNTGWAFSQKITKGSTGEKTISAKWCQNCKNVTGGSCSLNAETAGTCTYTTSCNTGYTLTSGANTYNPVCTANDLAFNNQTLAAGIYNTVYSQSFTGASNGTGTYTYQITGVTNNGVSVAINSGKYNGLSLSGTTISGTPTAAGTYVFTVKATDSNSGANKNVNISITINKVDAVISCSDKTYTGIVQTACSCSGGTIGGTYSATNAGTYTATCTGDSNHNNATNKNWTMNAKSISISWSSASQDYTGGVLMPNASASSGISGQTINLNVTGGGTNVGTHSATASCSSVTNGNCSNYTFTNTTATLTINKVSAVITCSDKTYTGSAQTACSCNGGTIGGTYSATNAGTYTATCTGDSNHNNATNKNWTMNAKSISISWSSASQDYTGGVLMPNASASSGISGQTINLNVTGGGTNVGTHSATASCSSVTNGNCSNYTFTNTTATLTINKVSAMITCSDKTYTGSAQTACSCNGGTIGGTYSATNAGTYTATCTGDSNHNNATNKNWTMKKASASGISCSNHDYTGGAITGCSCSGGTLGGTYFASAVGTYTATCTADGNHTLTNTSATWQIKSSYSAHTEVTSTSCTVTYTTYACSSYSACNKCPVSTCGSSGCQYTACSKCDCKSWKGTDEELHGHIEIDYGQCVNGKATKRTDCVGIIGSNATKTVSTFTTISC